MKEILGGNARVVTRRAQLLKRGRNVFGCSKKIVARSFAHILNPINPSASAFRPLAVTPVGDQQRTVVVDDQIGRLTFTDDIAGGIRHLLTSAAPYGTYNLTGGGAPASWADIAAEVYELNGQDSKAVSGVSTEQYFANANGPVAPRQRWSVLDLGKIEATGYSPRDWRDSLRDHLG